MPVFAYSAGDAVSRGQTEQYDLRNILTTFGSVNASNIAAITSVIFRVRITSDLGGGGTVSVWKMQNFDQGNLADTNWTGGNVNVPVSITGGTTGWVGKDYLTIPVGQQVADGAIDVAMYPVDGETLATTGLGDGTRVDVTPVALDTGNTVPTEVDAGTFAGEVETVTIFYSTVNDGIAPTTCGIFGQGAFGQAKFGAACSIVNAFFTVSPSTQGIAPTSFNFDASGTTLSPEGGVLTYAWDWGDGTVGGGIAPSHTYASPGLYRVTLNAFSDDGTYDAYYQIVIVGSPTSDIPEGRTVGGTLGCCNLDGYSAELIGRGGTTRLGDFSEWLETIDYNRVLDDVSQAEITVRKQGGCHDTLAQVDPWATELRIWREDQIVWEGPVVEYDESQDTARVTARDVAAYMRYRLLRNTLDYTILPGETGPNIARDIIKAAFSQDDPNVLRYLDIRNHNFTDIGQGPITRLIDVEQGQLPIAEQELRSLAERFVDWTVIGRRIVVWPDNYYLSEIGTIHQQHLEGDGWRIITRGDDYGSRFIVEGDAVRGEVGERNDRYGLLEQTVSDQDILDTATATKSAQTLFDARGARPPRWLVLDDGTELSCDAPVQFFELVPGVRIVADIGGDGVAQPIRQFLRISRVSVGVDYEGEKVRIGAQAIGYDGFTLGVVGEAADFSESERPEAAFTVSATSGQAPLLITLDSTGSTDPDGNIVQRSISWGDGSTTNNAGISVQHSYTEPGNYTIILTVTDDDGLTDTATVGIVVTASADSPPTARFTANPTGGNTVEFDPSTTTDPDGPRANEISAYSWNFGDGNTVVTSEPNIVATHTYDAPGTYTVTLTVTDVALNTDVATAQVNSATGITGNQPPTATFTATPTDLSVEFDASASSDPDGSITDYDWNFGDGQTGTGVNPTHLYASPGNYTVTLTVTDTGGSQDSQVQVVSTSASNQPPQASLIQYTWTSGEPYIELDASNASDPDGTIVEYRWSFDDGTPDQFGVTTNHTFPSNGTFEVTLTVTDDDGATGESLLSNLVVTGYPNPDFDADNASGLTVTFDASASTADGGRTVTDYAWDFGDTNTGTGQAGPHTYAGDGEYDVTLTVTDSGGYEQSITKKIQAYAGVVPKIDMVVLGDSIANLHHPGYPGTGQDQGTPRTRWQDRLAADIAAYHGRTQAVRKRWTQEPGNAWLDDSPSVAGYYAVDDPAQDIEGAVVQWDATAPGYLSEMYDTNGINALGDTPNSPFNVGHPPAANPRYVFICLGFNDVHGPAGGSRAGTVIRDNLITLADPYKDQADLIVFVGQWDANGDNPASALVAPNHVSGDMTTANNAVFAAYAAVLTDPATTAQVIYSDTPNTPSSTAAPDSVHPSTFGHTIYYTYIKDAMAAAGLDI